MLNFKLTKDFINYKALDGLMLLHLALTLMVLLDGDEDEHLQELVSIEACHRIVL